MIRNKYVLLDRDGVINYDSELYIKSPDEWIPYPGSLEAIAQLTDESFNIVVITNQSGVGQGLYDLSTLEKIHYKMNTLVEQSGGKIHSILYCPHHPNAGCDCRKPKPGLLHQLADQCKIDFTRTYFVGDALRDIEASLAVNAQPILVKTGKGSRTLSENPDLTTPIFNDLYDATQFILSQQ